MIYPQPAFSQNEYEQARQAISNRSRHKVKAGLILGSGLGALAEQIEDAEVIPYAEIPNFPQSGAPGHKGQMVLGLLNGVAVMAMQGRIHLYEGYSPARVGFPVRVMKMMGVETLLVTNAAGGINTDYQVGDLMMIEDHINFVGMAGGDPLRGPNQDEFGPRFANMSKAYDRSLANLARRVAIDTGVSLKSGTYAYVVGPTFETPAEIRMLNLLGADAVGMSTVPEVLVANHAGIRILGISAITNMAIHEAGSELETTEEEVWETLKDIIPPFSGFIKEIVGRL